MMQLTDGTSVVQGMEYRVIPALNHNLKPGTKASQIAVIFFFAQYIIEYKMEYMYVIFS